MTPSSWVEWVNRPEQNLKLVDRAANSRCNCVAVQGDVAAVGFEDSTIQIITIENLKVCVDFFLFFACYEVSVGF